MNNKHILKAIQNRDNAKLFLLVHKEYYSMVEHIVHTYGGSSEDAKDVFQEMLLILIREADSKRIDESLNVKNYIYTVAKNLFINAIRKHGRNISLETASEAETEEFRAERHIELRESKELVTSIIKELGEKCFEILKRILFENKRQEVIANELGLKDRFVVKSYKNRCKNRLIELLKKKPKLCLELLRNEEGFRKHIRIAE